MYLTYVSYIRHKKLSTNNIIRLPFVIFITVRRAIQFIIGFSVVSIFFFFVCSSFPSIHFTSLFSTLYLKNPSPYRRHPLIRSFHFFLFFFFQENDHLNPLAHLSDYHIYRIPNAKRCYNAPFEWGACLRPRSNAEAEDTEGGEHGLKVIAFHSEKARACWLTAMRLAKVT